MERQILLQWSHAQPNVETDTTYEQPLRGNRASMEPRSAERGNHWRLAGSFYRLPGFNGATLSRTWKLVLKGGAYWQLRGFNGATLSRTWKLGFDHS